MTLSWAHDQFQYVTTMALGLLEQAWCKDKETCWKKLKTWWGWNTHPNDHVNVWESKWRNFKTLKLHSPFGDCNYNSLKSSWVNVWWGQLCSNWIHSLINHKHFEKGYDKLGLHFQKLVCLENYVHLEKKMMLNWGA